VTARKPLVPAELPELLTLMRDLSEPLPVPARGPDGTPAGGAWQARREREIHRDALLGTRLHGLVDQIEVCDQYPSVAAGELARYCERASETIREELARPLGYEPDKEMEAQ
jgi:hypothetical protein